MKRLTMKARMWAAFLQVGVAAIKVIVSTDNYSQRLPHRAIVSKKSFNELKKAVENLRNQGVSTDTKHKPPEKAAGTGR